MRYLFRSAAALALIFAGPAAAQAVDLAVKGPPTIDKSAPPVEEIVVTARKRQENLRDIPATISAVTATQLADTGPTVGTGDLLRTVPGVRFNDLQAPNLSEISIRGSGTERATGADSGVGLFVNGAYVGSSTLGGRNFKNIDVFDLERVEVLEGPQGALYGRNSEFGLVNIVSAKPKFDNSGYVDESYTDKLDQNRLTAVENYAFSDEVAARVGVETIGQTKGFYVNPVNGQYYDHTDGWLARGQLRYAHGPLDVDVLVDGQDIDLPTFVNPYLVAPKTTPTIPLGIAQNRFNVPSNGVNATEQKVQRAMVLADYKLGWSTLTSTTMVTASTSLQHFGSPIDLATEAQLQKQGEVGVYPLGQVVTSAKDRTFYQDLHLGGTTLGGSLDWLGGAELLLQHDSNGLSSATSPCVLKVGAGVCGGTPTTPICDLLLATSTNCPNPFPAGFGSVSVTPQRYNSEAVYGSVRYRLGRFTFNGELRYTNDDKKATQYGSALYTGVPIGTPANHAFSADRTNYTATLSYKLPVQWDDLVYAKVGTGYRAGGVNTGVSTPLAPIPFSPAYGDEDTTSYEVGFKGGLGSHIFFTLDAYASTTDNAITSITDGCTLLNACKQGATVFNINGGTVHARGVEAAISSRFQIAGGRLSLDLNAGNQRATFASVSGTYAGLPITGSKVAQIPEWTTSATLDYRHRLAGEVDGFLHVVYNTQSGGGQDTVTTAIPYVPMSSIGDVSLRTGIDYRKLELAVFIQNLTDQTVQLLKLQTGGVPYANRYNEPLTVGVNLKYRW